MVWYVPPLSPIQSMLTRVVCRKAKACCPPSKACVFRCKTSC
ncbi:hypothetical protein ACLB1Q_05815 [Escherichia coli]